LDKKAKLMPYLAAVGTLFFWSSAFPAVKYALDYFSPGALMLFRFLIASAVLIIYCVIKKVALPAKKDLPMFVLCGLFGIFLYMWAFNAGTDLVPSGISGFIISAAPVFTLILCIIFLKEKASATIWVGVLISFAGIVLISITQITEGFQMNAGVWLLLAAAVSTSIFIVIQRHLLKKYTSMQCTAYPIIIGTIPMLIFAPELATQLPKATAAANITVVYLGVFPAAIAYFLWAYALSFAKKTVHITSFLYLSPFLASLMAFIWLGEVIPALAYAGGVVVIIGMVLTRR